MTSGVNGIGGNSYGYGNYGYNNNQAPVSEEETQQTVVQPEYKPVSNEAVMEFLEANNLRVVPKTSTPVEFDPEAQARIEEYMTRFAEIMGLIEQEFGEELAPAVMDLVMDRLMGLS